ncbi:MAG TPA: o-succinylbenzoate synthase [Myxococcaceae bacterium]|nr:o-succinylbenzoate synthase [Myxococcaceae bacterium]
MKLRRLDIQPLRLPLRTPLVTARETYPERRGWRVTVEDGEGSRGVGESMPLPAFGTEGVEASLAALRGVAARVAGLEARDVSEVEPLLQRFSALSGAPAARHAVECAVLELLALRQGRPLAALLGPSPRERIEVNALLSAGTPEAAAREAAQAVQAGFRTLKLKVGTGGVALDVSRLRAVREAVGPGVKLRIDPNGVWSEAQAVEALGALEPFGLELCEQPVAPSDFQALRRVRARVRVPIAADEAVPLPGAVDALLGGAEGPGVDVLVLKPMVVGGLLRTQALAERAARVGVGAYVTSSIDGPVARAAALHLAAVLPEARFAHGLAVGHFFVEPDPARVVPREGGLRVPTAPGLGLLENGP